MSSLLLALLATERLSIQTPATAQDPATREVASEKPLKPGDVELRRSRVYVKVGKTGLGHEHGVAGMFKSGHIQLDTSARAGEMVFDMATFVADTAEARAYVGLAGATAPATAQKVTQNMTGADVLDVRRFPIATFAVDSALPAREQSSKEGTQYILSGKFTLHGVTHPMQIQVVAISQKDGTTRLRGGFYINQTSFGITPYSTALGAVGVADQLAIYGEVYLAGGTQTPSPGR